MERHDVTFLQRTRLINGMEIRDESYTLNLARQGDRGAFEELVRRYKDMVYTICLRMLTSKEDAREAAQDVFVKVYRSLESFNEKSKFSTWLYRISYNQCISVIRKKVKLIDLVDDMPDTEVNEGDISGMESLSKEDRSRYLRLALDALPETDRVVVTLFYYEELSLEEIAEVTGLTNSNIRIKLHRSRKKMYQELKRNLKSEVSSIL